MGAYAKFIAAIIGMLVLALKQFFGIDMGDDFTTKLSDVIIMIITAFSVYWVPNKV